MDQPAPNALDDARETPSATVVCPFLVSTAGPWRNATPSREHRCSRDLAGVRLDLEHQRRYCLGSGGPGCPKYVEAHSGPFAPMLPVVLDRGPISATLDGRGLRRLTAPVSVVIVAAAIGALLLARGPGAPGPSFRRERCGRLACQPVARCLGQRRCSARERSAGTIPDTGGISRGFADASCVRFTVAVGRCHLHGQGRRHAQRDRGTLRNDRDRARQAQRDHQPQLHPRRAGPEAVAGRGAGPFSDPGTCALADAPGATIADASRLSNSCAIRRQAPTRSRRATRSGRSRHASERPRTCSRSSTGSPTPATSGSGRSSSYPSPRSAGGRGRHLWHARQYDVASRPPTWLISAPQRGHGWPPRRWTLR